MSGAAAVSEPISDQIRSRAAVASTLSNYDAGLQDERNRDQITVHLDDFAPHSNCTTATSSASSTGSKLTNVVHSVPDLLADVNTRVPVLAALFNVLLVALLTYLTESTHSLAFRCLVFLAIFDLSSLVTCLVSVWVSRQPTNAVFSFGYSRCEVLSVFSSSMLAMLGCFIVLKESVEHTLMPHDENLDATLVLIGTSMSLSYHLFVTYAIDNPAMSHVIQTAPSSWLQEHVADVSGALCAIVPGLDKVLLPRINSLVLMGVCCVAMLLTSTALVTMSSYVILDSISAACISLMMLATMLPLSIQSGKILVQTTPSHVVGQLEKTLREVSTLDGVLEFRKEHFWTIGFNKLCGSVQIRVRRDANEQMVLAHVLSRLSSSVSGANVTVQIFKDDWTQLSAATKFYYNKSCTSDDDQPHHSSSKHHSHSHSHSHDHAHSHPQPSSHSHDHHHTGGDIGSPSDSQVPRRFLTSQHFLNASATENPMKMI